MVAVSSRKPARLCISKTLAEDGRHHLVSIHSSLFFFSLPPPLPLFFPFLIYLPYTLISPFVLSNTQAARMTGVRSYSTDEMTFDFTVQINLTIPHPQPSSNVLSHCITICQPSCRLCMQCALKLFGGLCVWVVWKRYTYGRRTISFENILLHPFLHR